MGHSHTLVAGTHPYIGTQSDMLLGFCQALCRSDRKLKTKPRTENTTWVYADNELFIRGWIGWGDFQTTRQGSNKFAVYARDIENCKYSDHTDQYHMKMSLSMAPTLKAAKRNLTKYTTHEVEKVFRPAVRDRVQEVRNVLRNKQRALHDELGIQSYGRGRSKLTQELRHLTMSAHTFSDPQFGQDVQEFIEVSKGLDSLPDGVPMDFIHIYPTPWETRADVLAVSDALVTYGDTPTQLTWVADELPESVMGKVAVMQMCEDGQYVADVGFRVNEHTFYLHKESDDTWE